MPPPARDLGLAAHPPLDDAPLVKDIGKHPTGGPPYSVYDHAARASTGQRYALAGRRGDWTAIWYLGQKAWFHDPVAAPTSVPVSGPLVTPKPGLRSVKLYGRAYPEARGLSPGRPLPGADPAAVLATGRAALQPRPDDPRHLPEDRHLRPGRPRAIRGDIRYHQIQFGHRVMFVRASDVQVLTK